MTSPLRRKHPTTVRAASIPAPTICSLGVLVGLLLPGFAPAQQSAAPAYAMWPATPTAPVALNPPQPLPDSLGVTPTAYQPTVKPARYQPAAGGRDGEETKGYRIQVEPPGLERLSRLDSEVALMERIRQEVRSYEPMERVVFPDEPILSTQRYEGRGKAWPDLHLVVAPYYVCYERLLFQQKNFERYGWDLGILTPIVSASLFYWDLVTLPYHFFTAPCRQYECNTGYCLPGDPVPLMLYPPELSLTGAAAEVGAVALTLAIFP